MIVEATKLLYNYFSREHPNHDHCCQCISKEKVYTFVSLIYDYFRYGLDKKSACNLIYIVDHNGLITKAR